MLKLLIVEDDIIDQLALTRLIRKNDLDCDVTVAMKILEAKKLIEASSFDLVICDLNLPDGNAFDLEHLMGKQPFVLLSGHIEDTIIERATNYGAVQVLQKGSDLLQLKSVLNLIQDMLNQPNQSQDHSSNSSNGFPAKFNIQKLMNTFNNHTESVAGIIEDFLNEKENMEKEIFDAIASDKKSNIKFVAHKLKSRCALIGLIEQQVISENIEEQSKNEAVNISIIKEDMHKLNQSLEAAYPELENALMELKKQ